MITELERRLGVAFHEDALQARLVNPDHPNLLHTSREDHDEDRTPRHRWFLGVAAATTLIVIAGAVLIRTTREHAPPSTTIGGQQTELFVEIAPDSTVGLPPSPIGARHRPAAVWTGTEMVLWGGTPTGPGAAFDPATGVWREIAPSPIDVRLPQAVVWTGTEMIVWGGIADDSEMADGAAYDPASDTWRRLSDAPLGAATPIAVWTGDEMIVLGASPTSDPDNTNPSITEGAMAAYDPATDRWRSLAPVPGYGRPTQAVWTGSSILATATIDSDTARPTGDRVDRLVAYDISTDTWRIVGDATYGSLVGVPDADGVARTVIALPKESGVPAELLDSEGNVMTPLPGVPVDGAELSNPIETFHAIRVGGEMLFWFVRPLRPDPASAQPRPEEVWALNLDARTWRPLDTKVPVDPGAVVAAGDVALGVWNDGIDPTIPDSGGFAYRAPTTD